MRREAIILAGGSGTRAGGEMPKQFVELLGIPMLWWSVRAFHAYDPSTAITIVMHPGFFDLWDILYAGLPEADRRIPVRLVCGGRDRSHSVENGLMGIENLQNALVAVHDAARPLLSPDLVARCWETAGRMGSAVPCCPEVNSLRRVSDRGTVPMDRDGILVVQTPQVFRGNWLEDAYRRRPARRKVHRRCFAGTVCRLFGDCLRRRSRKHQSHYARRFHNSDGPDAGSLE